MRVLLKLFVWGTLLVTLIGVPLFYYFFELWRLPEDDAAFAASVEPTLSAGDVVLVSRRSRPTAPRLVRCGDPDAPGRFVVGRMFGAEDETISLEREALSIDGRVTQAVAACSNPVYTIANPATFDDDVLMCSTEEYGSTTYETLTSDRKPEKPWSTKIEGGKVVLLSDNRHIHLDTRDYGQVDPATCRAVAFRLWSSQGFWDADRRFTPIF